MRPAVATTIRTETLQKTLWSVDVVRVGVSAGGLGKGPAALGLRHTCLRKAIPVGRRRLGLGVISRLGSQYWCCASVNKLKLVYAKGVGRMVPLYPERGLHLLLGGKYSQKSSFPGVRVAVSSLCVSWLHSCWKQCSVLCILSQPSLLTSKIQNFRGMLGQGPELVFWGMLLLCRDECRFDQEGQWRHSAGVWDLQQSRLNSQYIWTSWVSCP